jgi:hypothetical protein
MKFSHHARRPAVPALIVGCLLSPGCVASRAQTPDNAGGAASQNSQVNPNDTPDQIAAVPNRPTFSTTAESVQPGVFEIEYGMEAAGAHENINGLLKLGMTKNLELRFGNNLIERDAGVAGRGDSGAGFKYKIFEEKSWRPTFSYAVYGDDSDGDGAGRRWNHRPFRGNFAQQRFWETSLRFQRDSAMAGAAGGERIRPGLFYSAGVLPWSDGTMGRYGGSRRIQSHQRDDAGHHDHDGRCDLQPVCAIGFGPGRLFRGLRRSAASYFF